MRSMLANDSDKPKCDSSAARPMPAAIPARGASHREAPDAAGAAGVGRAPATPGCAGITGLAAAPDGAAADGAGAGAML